MTYRSREEALRQRKADLEEDLAGLERSRREVEAALAAAEDKASAAEERLREAGPMGGPRGATRDRVGLAAIVLVAVAALFAPLHAYWNHWVGRDNTVIPAILILAAPGVLAALVSWPYRSATRVCRVAAILGALLAVAPFGNVVVGLLLEASR